MRRRTARLPGLRATGILPLRGNRRRHQAFDLFREPVQQLRLERILLADGHKQFFQPFATVGIEALQAARLARQFDGTALGGGTPGPVATRLREIYLEESRKAAV